MSINVSMITLFSSVVIRQQVNSLGTRQIIQFDVSTFDFVWTHLGLADDTPEMMQRQLRQTNWFWSLGICQC